MGACLVGGLNNWDRVASYRKEWEASSGGSASAEQWAAEFRALVPRKELYQDRFVILSRGPYSAVEAADVGFEPAEWLELSLGIRREHELTHYFTRRVFGAMRNNIFDEILADWAALIRVFGNYRARRALLFLGLEDHPRYRSGGRLETYRGDPPISDAALRITGELTVRAARNLEVWTEGRPELEQGLEGLARLTTMLGGLTLEELAWGSLEERAPLALTSES
jgi:hypothetical protein